MDAMLALIGGEEFADGFEDVHAELADAVRSRRTGSAGPLKVVFLPTCAAHDGLETAQYWCDQARLRLSPLGAEVTTPLILDKESANEPGHAELIAAADWVYIGGGFPHVAMKILAGTLALKALQAARKSAALISGASAGGMLLCSHSWVITPEVDEAIGRLLQGGGDPENEDLPVPPPLECLGFVRNTLCWPHYNVFHSMKLLKNGGAPKGCTVIGVEEQTAALQTSSKWEVLGRGSVSIIAPDYKVEKFSQGAQFQLA